MDMNNFNSKRPILLVDDDDMVRRALKRSLARDLQSLGIDVVEASDGQVALDLLRGGLIPVLVISDIDMPILNGLDLAKQCKEEFPSIPFILCSGGDHQDSVKKLGLTFFAKGTDSVATLKEEIKKHV